MPGSSLRCNAGPGHRLRLSPGYAKAQSPRAPPPVREVDARLCANAPKVRACHRFRSRSASSRTRSTSVTLCHGAGMLSSFKQARTRPMRTIFVLFDSLMRTAVGCYGSTTVQTPNFDRFARRAVTFDTHFVGSLPCMPARRDLHTGRLNFMHRSWGPLEPFDNSFPEQMRDAGIHTHLVTDHMHYFEDGGATYHGRFRTWDFIRGQEYDPWKAMVDPPIKRLREKFARKHYDFDDGWKRLQHAINCEFMEDEEDFCLPRCFASGFEFLDLNREADDWFLMLECFDPHEPFHAPARFKN